jgi:ankyrin repeat protein
MVRLLLKHGGDANLRDFNGRTALHHLVGVRPKNEVAIAKLLMSFGANPRIRENNGATPMELCSYGAFEVAKICYAGHRRVPRIPRYSLLAGPCFRVRRIE